ncbi:MAG TPA: hypothetical protein VGU64_01860 [Terriglobales bacterium]|nr:hypothetical protein [Terriglobales bacterium]
MASDLEKIQGMTPDVNRAQERARHLVDELAARGDPQTEQATVVFQRLTRILLSLFDLQAPPKLPDIVSALDRVAETCTGALLELGPPVQHAASIGRDP